MSNKVNLNSFNIQTYSGSQTPVWCAALPTRSFTDLDGDWILGGNGRTADKDSFVKVAVTDNGDGSYTTEPFTGSTALSATRWNGVDQNVRWNFYLLDARLNIIKNLQQNVVIANTVETTTMEEAERLTRGDYFPRTTSHPSFDDLNLLLADLDLAPDATTLTKGKGVVDTAPADTNNPIFVGANSPRIAKNLYKDYGNSLSSAAAAIASTDTVLEVTRPVTVSANTDLSATGITLDIKGTGLITVAAGRTLTVGKMIDSANRQVFDVSASNAKVLFSRSAVEEINIGWYCGTDNGTDATKAINQALESCSNNDGGNVFFPEARYVSSGGHIVPKATTLIGSGQFITVGYGGTNIKLVSPTTTYLFKIGDTTYDTGFINLTLDGAGTTNKDGILYEGTAPNSSGGSVIDRLVISGFQNGINYNSLSVGTTWQMAQISIDDSKFIGCAVGIRQTSVNSSWDLENTNFYIPEDGWAMVLENGGIMVMKSCEFAGNSNPNAAGIQINGAHVNINLMGCQEEGTVCFLENNASDESGIINLYGNLIQSKIQVNASCVINSHGNNYLSKVFKFGGVGTVARITSIGDHVQERDVADGVTVVSPAILTEGGVNDSHIVLQQSGELGNFITRLPQEFISPLPSLGNPNTPVASFGHITNGTDEDKILLRLGRMTTSEVFDFYYDVYRDHGTGYLHFAGNQSDPNKAFSFNAAVFVPDEAYDATTWNGNNSVTTKNAVRDRIEAILTAMAVGTLSVGGGATITKELKNTATLDFGSIAAGTSAELTIAVTGATVGSVAFASPNTSIETGLVWSAYVSAADTVTVRLSNVTVGAIDPASKSWAVWVRV